MSGQAWYQQWFNSPYYYLLYYNRNEEEAFAFIRRLIAYLQPGQNCKILDVACGKGRHSRALAEMGFDVTGIDLSPQSIEEAKKSEGKNLHFFQHDMRLPFWINYFDYALNLFTSFGYFRTEREHYNAIRTISNSLKNEGVFVIDYLNVHFAEDNLKQREVKTVNDVAFNITRWHDEHHFYKQIQIIDPHHPPHHLYTEIVAKFTLADLTDMLSYYRMQVQEVFGSYELNSYDVKKSPRMIIIAKKLSH